MDKEQYLKIRGEEEIPLSLFYNYYKDMGGTGSLEQFERVFPQAMAQGLVPGSLGEPRFMDFTSIVDKVYKYFNQKFEV